MRCGKCGSDNREGRKFCAKCGAPLLRSCSKCGASSNEAGEDFCGDCGAPLAASSSPHATEPVIEGSVRIAAGSSSADDGERKTLTTLFADLKGSMELQERVDPEEARAIVDPALKLMIEAVHHYDGYVAQSTGDGIFALFGAPVAHEDDPQRALHAALRMQEDLRRHFAKQQLSGQAPPIEARVGVHTGEVVVRSLHTAEGRDQYVPVGHSIGLAARMQALAPPGSVAVSESTRKLCEGYFNFRSLGATKVKGISETVDVHEVLGLGALRTRLQRSAARGLTPFIGRADETRTLWNRWGVAREGEGQVVLIAGEAGIGKSRVIHQFHERLAGTPHRWVEGAAEPYFQNTPFHALGGIVNQAFSLNTDQKPDEILDQLERALKQNGIEYPEAVVLIAQLLNLPVARRYRESTLSPEPARKRLLATLAKGLFALAASQPMVFALEDLQWADASTLEFLGLLVEQAATAPVMVLLTTRPDFEAPWPTRAHHTQITLGRLRDREVREMVSAVAVKNLLRTEAIEAVAIRSSGVPLFIEELTRAVLERGGASREIPGRLQNSLVARLDGLGSAKVTAQVASVIGREFSYELLSSISPTSEDELQASLARLADAELIYVRGIARDATYIFKHALVRDAAYETLLKSRRKDLHRRLAQAIVDRFPRVAEAQPEALARHWAQAGDAKSALAAWQRAADTAFARHALKEAEENYRQAAEILKQLPDSPERDEMELKLVSLLVQVLHNTRGHAAVETVEASARARELARRSGTFSRLYQQNFQAFQIAGGLGDFPKSALIAEETLELARLNEKALHDGKVEGSNPASLVLRFGHGLPFAVTHGMMQIARYMRGDLPGSEANFQRQDELFTRAGQELVKMFPVIVSYASWTAWKMGRIELARERNKQALAAAKSHEEPESRVAPQVMAAISDPIVTAAEREDLALDVIAVCEPLGIPAYVAEAKVALGRARLELGARSEGLELIKTGIGGTERITHLYDTYHYAVLAEAFLLNERTEEALAAAEKAVIVNPSEVVHRSEAYRIRGIVRLKKTMVQLAEADFREAITLSQSMSAKLLELRAVTSLARLLRDTSRRDEACAMLPQIYGWFTDGFDSVDLRDAKILCDELSA